MPSEIVFTAPHPLNTAVLFLVFNRLDTTKQVFQTIRQTKPPRLYVAADGARDVKEGENEKVQAVREYILKNIDWECDVKTLFREKNLGCKYAVSGAINWFFENEEMGIILEDDCLPNVDFFRYCEWALYTYKDNKEIWHINGNNFQCSPTIFQGENISFSALAQVWGWASWSNRWQKFEINPFYLQYSINQAYDWQLSIRGKLNKYHHLQELIQGLDTWDYQWQITILNNNGLCISSQSNLISNLGDGVDATHTQKDIRARMKTQKVIGSLSYVKPEINQELTVWYEKKMGLRRIYSACSYLVKEAYKYIERTVRNFISNVFFSNITPIVIASTGRSGSTILFNAVSGSLVRDKYGLDEKSRVGRLLISMSSIFDNRLEDIKKTNCIVHKTHDLFDIKYGGDARYIFVYGDPIESIQSVEQMTSKHGSIWLEEHLFHLVSSGRPENLYNKDILNYKKQMESWNIPNNSNNILIINFEDLWDKASIISKFIGFELVLPERKERSAKSRNIIIDAKLRDDLNAFTN